MNNNLLPLYAQISEHLRDNIRIGKWNEGDKIPTENELCAIYNASRITIRKAINELVNENLLVKIRAKGTFVTASGDNTENYTIIKSFTEEMKEMGKEARTLDAKIEVSKASLAIANYLKIKENDKIIVLKRLRGDDNKAFAYFVTYIKFDSKYSLNANNYYGSLYKYLNSLGIYINQEREIVEAITPSYEVRNALNIQENTPVLKRVRFTNCKQSNFYEYTECFYIGNLYKYYLDFSHKV